MTVHIAWQTCNLSATTASAPLMLLMRSCCSQLSVTSCWCDVTCSIRWCAALYARHWYGCWQVALSWHTVLSLQLSWVESTVVWRHAGALSVSSKQLHAPVTPADRVTVEMCVISLSDGANWSSSWSRQSAAETPAHCTVLLPYRLMLIDRPLQIDLAAIIVTTISSMCNSSGHCVTRSIWLLVPSCTSALYTTGKLTSAIYTREAPSYMS